MITNAVRRLFGAEASGTYSNHCVLNIKGNRTCYRRHSNQQHAGSVIKNCQHIPNKRYEKQQQAGLQKY